MYILYNNDGSIKETNFAEIINKGNDRHNSVFVGFPNNPNFPNGYVVYALFKLPDGEVAGPINGVDDTLEYDDDTTITGLSIPITAEVTQLAGQVKMTVYVARSSDDSILYTYPTILVINDTGLIPPDLTKITLSQYENLLSLINQRWAKTVKTEGNQAIGGTKSFDNINTDGLTVINDATINGNLAVRGTVEGSLFFYENQQERSAIDYSGLRIYGQGESVEFGFREITYTNGDDEYVINYFDINNAVTHILYKHTIDTLVFDDSDHNDGTVRSIDLLVLVSSTKLIDANYIKNNHLSKFINLSQHVNFEHWYNGEIKVSAGFLVLSENTAFRLIDKDGNEFMVNRRNILSAGTITTTEF